MQQQQVLSQQQQLHQQSRTISSEISELLSALKASKHFNQRLAAENTELKTENASLKDEINKYQLEIIDFKLLVNLQQDQLKDLEQVLARYKQRVSPIPPPSPPRSLSPQLALPPPQNQSAINQHEDNIYLLHEHLRIQNLGLHATATPRNPYDESPCSQHNSPYKSSSYDSHENKNNSIFQSPLETIESFHLGQQCQIDYDTIQNQESRPTVTRIVDDEDQDTITVFREVEPLETLETEEDIKEGDCDEEMSKSVVSQVHDFQESVSASKFYSCSSQVQSNQLPSSANMNFSRNSSAITLRGDQHANNNNNQIYSQMDFSIDIPKTNRSKKTRKIFEIDVPMHSSRGVLTPRGTQNLEQQLLTSGALPPRPATAAAGGRMSDLVEIGSLTFGAKQEKSHSQQQRGHKKIFGGDSFLMFSPNCRSQVNNRDGDRDTSPKIEFERSCSIQDSASFSMPDEDTSIQLNITQIPKENSQKLHREHSDSNSQVVSTNSLIEGFFIFSANEQTVKELDFKETSTHKVQPTTIYQNSADSKYFTEIESTLHTLTFPKGLTVKRKLKTESLSDLIEVISQESRDQGFVFTMRTEQSFLKMDYSSANKTSGQSDIIDEINPSKLMYCICMSHPSFVDLPTSSKKKRPSYCEVEVVYGFLTKLPAIPFFLSILQNIISIIKLEKMMVFGQTNSVENLGIKFFSRVRKQIEVKLGDLFTSRVPLYENTLILPMYSNDRNVISLAMPAREFADRIENNWGILGVLKRFISSPSQFVNIYISILLEHSTAFVSADRTLLSQFILLFHSLLKPKKWPHPLIFALPNTLNDLFDAPTPIVFGLLEKKSSLDASGFARKYPDFNILYIDEMKLSHKVAKENSEFLDTLRESVGNVFEELSRVLRSFSEADIEISFEETSAVRLACLRVFSVVKEHFLNQIVYNLPESAILHQGNHNLNLNAILSQVLKAKHRRTDTFLSSLFHTQGFMYFLEEHYGIK